MQASARRNPSHLSEASELGPGGQCAVVTFVVYLLLTRNLDAAAEQAAIDASEAELRRIDAATSA